MRIKKNNKRSRLKEWLLSFMYAVFFLILFRNFIFTVYTVQSESMKPALLPGDCISVNLLAYGPRIPSTPVCIPFTSVYLKQSELPVWRIPGYSKPKRNDLIVFNYPGDKKNAIERKEVYLKRIIALPGDSIGIQNNKVRVNGKMYNEASTVTTEFIIQVYNKNQFYDWIKTNAVPEPREIIKGDWLVNLSNSQFKKIKVQKFIKTINVPEYSDDAMLETLFTGKLKGYNVLNFAFTRVPFKGMKIELNPVNVQLYAHCILNENHTLALRKKQVLIDGIKQTEYVFEEDYYFVLGDARSLSVDSRHWGFVPRSHLLGRVSFKLFSFGNNN